MNELIDAVLKNSLDRVRELTRVNPELANARSDAGNLPLDIARSTGSSFTHVSLLRLGAPSDVKETPDFTQLLIDYIAQLSDAYACAGWLSDIEFVVYASTVGDNLNGRAPHGFDALDDETLSDLRFLLDRSGKWPRWTDDDGVQPIAISEWEPIYKQWLSREPK